MRERSTARDRARQEGPSEHRVHQGHEGRARSGPAPQAARAPGRSRSRRTPPCAHAAHNAATRPRRTALAWLRHSICSAEQPVRVRREPGIWPHAAPGAARPARPLSQSRHRSIAPRARPPRRPAPQHRGTRASAASLASGPTPPCGAGPTPTRLERIRPPSLPQPPARQARAISTRLAPAVNAEGGGTRPQPPPARPARRAAPPPPKRRLARPTRKRRKHERRRPKGRRLSRSRLCQPSPSARQPRRHGRR